MKVKTVNITYMYTNIPELFVLDNVENSQNHIHRPILPLYLSEKYNYFVHNNLTSL